MIMMGKTPLNRNVANCRSHFKKSKDPIVIRLQVLLVSIQSGFLAHIPGHISCDGVEPERDKTYSAPPA